MVFKPWDPDKVIREMDFTSVPFWVQVHGLPRNRMGEENAKFIGLKLGTFLELDVTKPLVAGFPIPHKGVTNSWVQFKFEKLADFCNVCGCLGNTQHTCKELLLLQGKAFFGPKMRVESFNLRRDAIVRVVQAQASSADRRLTGRWSSSRR